MSSRKDGARAFARNHPLAIELLRDWPATCNYDAKSDSWAWVNKCVRDK